MLVDQPPVEDLLFVSTFGIFLGHNSISLKIGSPPLGMSSWNVELPTELHSVPMLRMYGALLSKPLHTVTVW